MPLQHTAQDTEQGHFSYCKRGGNFAAQQYTSTALTRRLSLLMHRTEQTLEGRDSSRKHGQHPATPRCCVHPSSMKASPCYRQCRQCMQLLTHLKARMTAAPAPLLAPAVPSAALGRAGSSTANRQASESRWISDNSSLLSDPACARIKEWYSQSHSCFLQSTRGCCEGDQIT